MHTTDFAHLDLIDAWYEHDPAMRIRVTFPFFAATGTEQSAVVYFEIDPGHELGTHTDSAEEIVLILAGRSRRAWVRSVDRCRQDKRRSFRRWRPTGSAISETRRHVVWASSPRLRWSRRSTTR